MRNTWFLIYILMCLSQSVYAQGAAAKSTEFIQVTQLNFARWDADRDDFGDR